RVLASTLDVAGWLAALAVYVASQWVSAWRWSRLARGVGLRSTYRQCLRWYFEGSFFSLCLPTSIGGDVWKAWRLAGTSGERLLAGCTVLADRLAGLTALLVIGLAALAKRSFQLSLGETAVVALGLYLGALAAITIALAALDWLGGRLWRWPLFGDLVFKLSPFGHHPAVAWEAVTWGLVVQSLNVAAVWLLGRALGLDLPTGVYAFAVPLVSLATVLPISLNGVGVREGGLAWVLASYAVPQAQAAMLGLLWTLVNMTSGLLGGIVYATGRERRGATIAQRPTQHADQVASSPPQLRISPMNLSAVIPVYNERENIERLYDSLSRALAALGQPYEIVLVDDGSNDGSSRALDQLAARDPAVKVVHFRRNFGQTAAMNAGLHLATGDVIVTLDADLQNDPGDIALLLAKLDEGYDLVHGWRKERQDAFLSRKLPSKIANSIISRTTGFPVHDLGCTLKAMRREIAHDLQLYGEMHRFIPILAHWRGARCAEVVTRHHPRRFGTSKYGLSRTFRVVLDLITVKYMIQYLTSPMKLFGGIGLASWLLAGASGAATVAMKCFGEVDMTGNPFLLLTVFAALAGTQFIVLGMLGELCVRTYYESQNKQPYAIRSLVNFDAAQTPQRKAA
ncbi:MAG TPA: glycosyltransferase, partial [Pirellulales bacterium]|nr:glycosyltransferase [Pirellulales bacterium]